MKIRINNKFLILLFSLFCACSQLINSNFSYLAISFYLIYIIFSKNKDILYLIYFLIPNIRIFDNLGFVNYVNILIYVTGFSYLIFVRRKKVNVKNIIFPVIIVMIYEMLHIYYYINNIYFLEEIITIITFLWNLMVFCVLISDSKEIKFWKIGNYLVAGVIISSVIKAISYKTNMITYLLNSKERFSGYAGDPNYFSLYLLFSLVYLLFFYKGKSQLLLSFIIMFIGIITSSKMFFLCLIVILIIYFYLNCRNINFIIKIIPIILIGLTIIFYFFGDIIIQFIQKIIERFGINDNLITIESLTTGRSELVKFYIEELLSNFYVLVFGIGMRYNYLLQNLVAHNTYLDILMSWGIIGILFFILILNKYRKYLFKIKEISNYLILIIFMIVACALSGLTADMFFYLLFFSIKPIINDEKWR